MKKILLVSDLHLDDTSQNEYRWDIFDQIKNKIVKHGINSIYLLGDLTDKKDRHSSSFVNRMVKEVSSLRKSLLFPSEIVILAGNHDYVNQNLPFFSFLDDLVIAGKQFENYTKSLNIRELFLPHVKNPKEIYSDINFNKYDICFTHLDVKGTKLENGMKSLEGLPTSFFSNALTFSGHIHVGQKIGNNFYYLGSPYSVVYEREDILHRGVLLTYEQKGKISYEDTYFNFPRKVSKKIKSIDDVKNVNTKNLYKIDVEVPITEIDIFNELKDKFKTQENIKVNLKIKHDTMDKETSKKEMVKNSKNPFKDFISANKINEKIENCGKELMKNDQV